MSRILRDSKGAYDLGAVIAIGLYQKKVASQAKDSYEPPRLAILHMNNGGAIHSELDFEETVAAWTDYLDNPKLPYDLQPFVTLVKQNMNQIFGKFASAGHDDEMPDDDMLPKVGDAAPTRDAADGTDKGSPPTN